MAIINPTIVNTPIPVPVGAAPSFNQIVGTAGAKVYVLMWTTALRGATTIIWATALKWTDATVSSTANVFAATTYAEIQTKATELGITNLPADPAL